MDSFATPEPQPAASKHGRPFQLLCLAFTTLGLWLASDGAIHMREGKMALGILLVLLGCIGFLRSSRRT